ncbi:MAG: hypothetical protein JWO89_2047 [Verrucomicrobiaceae bacterium]|nr:hypothetical protein [Verrucomicrobiaceae bacterium]
MEFLVWTAIYLAQTLHTMPMSATSNFTPCLPTLLFSFRRWATVLALFLAVLPPLHASEAEDAARALAKQHEKEGFEFRADSWQKSLRPDMGKAIRMQLFKGNDYRFCVAVPTTSGVHLAATVLDFDGKPTGKAEGIAQGWGVVVAFKPKKTGTYVVAIRQTEDGKPHDVPCVVITGWK